MADYAFELGAWKPEYALTQASTLTNDYYQLIPDTSWNDESDTVEFTLLEDFGAAGPSGKMGFLVLQMGEWDSETSSDTLKLNLPDGWSFKTPDLTIREWRGAPVDAGLYSDILDQDGHKVGTVSIQYPNRIFIDGEEVFRGSQVPCFTRGTLIETVLGPRAVEDLRPGDMVLTRDRGPQPVRWCASSRLGEPDLARNPKQRPIRIAAGTLAPGVPARPLIVSPQHRMLIRSAHARAMFGVDEVLVAARHLLALDGVEVVEDGGAVEYFHLLFDHHEVILAHGAETESFYLGPQALRALGPAALARLVARFPEIAREDFTPHRARLLPKGNEGRRLVARHLADGTLLVTPAGQRGVAGVRPHPPPDRAASGRSTPERRQRRMDAGGIAAKGVPAVA